jgi:sigma-B regulation protein RsbU (phosphoserine phosphatase)
MVPSVRDAHVAVGNNHRVSAPPYRFDLEEARKVQEQLFPRELPRIPGWDIAAACRPARIVSGDYCDVIDLGEGQIAFALGDVSGTGLGPALVMAGLRALVHALLPHLKADLAGLVCQLNAYLLATTPDDMFVTLFLAVLDVSTGQVRYVNAGHIPPLVLVGPDGEEPMRFTVTGPVLGIFPDVIFEQHQVGLKPGCQLAVFSDGITEAMNAAGKMFHERRVVGALREGWGMSARRVLNRLLHAVERFTERAENADDISAILLQKL